MEQSKDKRYVVTMDMYVYAPNDYMARRRAHKANDKINAIVNVQDSEVVEIGSQPFASFDYRKFDDISKPKDKSKDDELPF